MYGVPPRRNPELLPASEYRLRGAPRVQVHTLHARVLVVTIRKQSRTPTYCLNTLTISEEELQQQFTWLNSESDTEYEVQPGLFFGNAHDDSDGVYLRTERTTIRGQASSGELCTKLWFETPPELFTDELWKSHGEWFQDHAL